MHWICPLYKLSTCWTQLVEHIWTPCYEVLSSVESNLKLVKLLVQHSSTFPLFRGHPCVAQQSQVHLHSNARHVEPTHAQCPAYTKIAMVHLHHFLVTCSVLNHELFHNVVVASFFCFLSSSLSLLTKSAAKHFRVLRGWIYLRFSATIQHEPLWNLRNAQHVESLSRSFEHPTRQHVTPQQALNMLRACTVNKSSALAGGLTVSGLCSYHLSGTFFFWDFITVVLIHLPIDICSCHIVPL